MTSRAPQSFISDSHLSYVVARWSREHRALKVVVTNNHHIWQMQEELALFLPPDQHSRIITFPDWETLPYDQISSHRNITGRRIQALYQLTQTPDPILITSVNASGYRVVPRSFIIQECMIHRVGDRLSTEQFRAHMLEKGYNEVGEVADVGQFAIRGSILDVMTTHQADFGYRIELFDNEIDSIRHLDISSNRSAQPIERIHILPSKEYVLTPASQKEAMARIPEFPEHLQAEARQLLGHVNQIGGAEYYMPLFHSKLETLSSYLPDQYTQVQDINYLEAVKNTQAQVHEAYQRQIDQNRPVIKPECLLDRQTDVPTDKIIFQIEPTEAQLDCLPLPRLNEKTQSEVLATLREKHTEVVIYAQNQSRIENLFHCLHSVTTPCVIDKRIPGQITITQGNLHTGLIDVARDCVLISENDILGRLLNVGKSRERRKRLIEDNIEHWEVGTLIVHRDYGIGKFLSFTSIKRDGHEGDYLVLAYQGEDRLYVATGQFHLLSRYIGPKIKHTQLARLDGKKWTQKKKKAIEHADQLAEKLLAQHAKRQAYPAEKCVVSSQDYAKFCEYFPYTETEDQLKAIECILGDIRQSKAMNRLLCGDVGFGKTEVAMRAAFVAAMSGLQVAVLAPTAILAQQHYHTFTQRFGPFPLRIAQLSRLGVGKDRESIKESLRQGCIDIIVATHSLLQPDIQFKNLGLLVIDEEHKFGVKQKELMGHMATHAHTLAMSATPIPRTLHMSLAKLRDISVIATPPKNRQAICTFVEEYSDRIVKEAIQREFNRGGQCYVIHNDIRSLAIIKDNINALLPQIRVRVMHAKQSKSELEHTMVQFQKGEFDCLLATTIVESGIDISNANTMIINRADQLGLSQIHQLRGRVGRSHHQAYAYLLTPSQESMTDTAIARMKTIAKQKHLGAGLNIALEDLEIRGAGDLLGKSQSGSVEEMGLSLYSQLLRQATQKARGEVETKESSQIEIDLGLKTNIPDTYIKDFSKRLNYYRLISCAENGKILEEVRKELEDFYGMMPDSINQLIEQRKIQHIACRWSIQALKKSEESIEMCISDQKKLLDLVKHFHEKKLDIRILNQKVKILNITDSVDSITHRIQEILTQ